VPIADPSRLTGKQFIQRWRSRRMEILRSLAPELRAEYRRLGRLIRDITAELSDSSPVGSVEPRESFGLVPSRIPLLDRKQKLIEFLRSREGATRVEITKATRIPAGSLSSLLKGAEFEQARHGFWTLKKGKK
jgi:hypothetical protein